VKADPETEANVMSVVRQWFESFAHGDIKGVLSFVAPDSDVVIIGTNKNDRCVGPLELKQAAERAFNETRGSSVTIGWRSVSMSGGLALVSADVTFHGKNDEREIYFPLRYTAALENRGDRWLIVQSHDSLPSDE
jgi:ketosteroid isomerase-like protein